MFKWFKLLFHLDDKRASASSPSTPRTLQAELANPYLKRPRIFDPALIPYNAIRGGEPMFEQDEDAERWYGMRKRVLYHILARIGESLAYDHLVLRGSMLLAMWCGPAARRPADLDWVISPVAWSMESPRARQLLRDIEDLLRGSNDEGNPRFSIPDIPFVNEEIWTYDKAPGRRLIIPWRCTDKKWDGTIQMDFVFGEVIPSPPILMEFPSPDDRRIKIQAASMAQSLAWKLLWLETDQYAQGKDLYDAVLLAENTSLDSQLLRKTFACGDIEGADLWHSFNEKGILQWNTEWEEFQKEYPQIQGSEQEWKERLVAALKPLLSKSL